MSDVPIRVAYVNRTGFVERAIARAFLGSRPTVDDMLDLKFEYREDLPKGKLAVQDRYGPRVIPVEDYYYGDRAFKVAFDWTAMRAYYKEIKDECEAGEGQAERNPMG